MATRCKHWPDKSKYRQFINKAVLKTTILTSIIAKKQANAMLVYTFRLTNVCFRKNIKRQIRIDSINF